MILEKEEIGEEAKWWEADPIYFLFKGENTKGDLYAEAAFTGMLVSV